MNESFSTFLETLSAFGPRLVAALIAGTIIGIEGEIFRRAAGLRTTILISLGTTLFAILSVVVAQSYGGDPARIAAQIVTGIGFLGAGVIMHAGGEVYGITTAATIFTTAAIGVTIGFGYTYTGVALSLVVALVLMVFRPVHRFVQNLEIIRRYREREFKAIRADREEAANLLAMDKKKKTKR
ncbi:MAG: MgtC/SapB family protein [Leptospiraceae bacterium]|nr:MgtC/SapB family protein [Leptospiraceae bacterium]